VAKKKDGKKLYARQQFPFECNKRVFFSFCSTNWPKDIIDAQDKSAMVVELNYAKSQWLAAVVTALGKSAFHASGFTNSPFLHWPIDFLLDIRLIRD
jgi:hypothetical protein